MPESRVNKKSQLKARLQILQLIELPSDRNYNLPKTMCVNKYPLKSYLKFSRILSKLFQRSDWVARYEAESGKQAGWKERGVLSFHIRSAYLLGTSILRFYILLIISR